MKINNKELSGCSYADGTHWYWGGKEVAVMDDLTGEIEWCVRTNSIPNAVVEAVRSKKPKAAGQWLIEVKRVSQSATQGIAHVLLNGETVAVFADEKILNENGKWVSKIPDEEIGKYVAATFWHPHDNVYHFSSKARKIFGYNKERVYEVQNEEGLEMHRMLALSTVHISEKTAKSLDADAVGIPVYQKSYQNNQYGWFIPVTDWEDYGDDIPKDLAKCLAFAEKRGFDWLIFDYDVQNTPLLPTYKWNTKSFQIQGSEASHD